MSSNRGRYNIEQEATIRIDDDCSVYKPICRGVRQGCVLSPDLFNICSEIILRNLKHHEGVRVGGNNINNLRYADDTVLIADSEEKLQNILTTVAVESENKGLQLNAKKTECMVISKQSDIPVSKGQNTRCHLLNAIFFCDYRTERRKSLLFLHVSILCS